MIEYTIHPPGVVGKLLEFRKKEIVLEDIPPFGCYKNNSDNRYYMSKDRFIPWIEEIKKHFKLGDWICLKTIPIVPNNAPMYYGIIAHVNEFHYTSPLHPTLKEPEVIIMQDKSGGFTKWAPGVLRHIIGEEKAFALSRDKPTFSSWK